MASVSTTMVKAGAAEDVERRHQRCPLERGPALAGDDSERAELAEYRGLLGRGDTGGPDKLGGVDLGQTDDRDALRVGRQASTLS